MGSQQVLIFIQPTHQHAFTHSLIGRLLNLLVHSNQYRLVTLQLTLIVLKELVCSPDSPPGLTPRQLTMFEKAYSAVAATLENRLGGEVIGSKNLLISCSFS